MKEVRLPIQLSTIYLFIYVSTSHLGLDYRTVVFMFALSPIVIIWLVIRVLKDGKASSKTFDNYFYEDLEMKRNTVSE